MQLARTDSSRKGGAGGGGGGGGGGMRLGTAPKGNKHILTLAHHSNP